MLQALIGRCYIDGYDLLIVATTVAEIVEYATVRGILASPANHVNRMPTEETNPFSSQVTAAHPKPMPAAILSLHASLSVLLLPFL